MALDVEELLIHYWNWLSRLVPAEVYTVHQSDALAANVASKFQGSAEALARIVSLLSVGGDVSPHLSRLILKGFQANGPSTSNLKKRRDLDLLLNDWGIHHFHLSTVVESDGFVSRTGPLLLAVFKRRNAYLIDIINHREWTKESIAGTIIRNWRDAGIFEEIKGVAGRSRIITEAERAQLRNAAINAFVEFDGKVYMSSAGMVSSGAALRGSMAVDRLMEAVERFAARLEADPLCLDGVMRANGVEPPSHKDLHFQFVPGGYGILESRTKVLFRLSGEPTLTQA